jgi:hypothetical protein
MSESQPPPPPTQLSPRDQLLEYLKREGFRPEIDDDGDICFKLEGGVYFLIFDPSDALYLRLLYPNFWSIDSKEELARALHHANGVSRDIKVAKVVVNAKEDDVSCAVELFMPVVMDFELVFYRSVRVIQDAVRLFAERMRGND